QLWRFISYSVVHEGWVHVCTNVFMELFFGFLLESAHGSKRTAVVFLTGVLGGAVACATLDTHSSVAGASGGVFGLVAAQIAVVLLHWQSL
ncbi:peptidase S54, rhomboid domain-containing protein, partial [Pelagophyceae sp. CCMP2097]